MRKLVSLFAIAAMILAVGACKKEDQPKSPGKMSDLQYLIDGLVKVDASGKILGYNIGDGLNEANPWEISVPVDSYEEAVALFKDNIPADAVLDEQGDSVTWDMTDPDGKSEGKAILKKNDLLGAVATLTVTPLLQASGSRIIPSVTFLPSILWPENSGAAEEILNRDYYLGAAIYKGTDEGFGWGPFVVVRPWTPQESGLLVRLVSPPWGEDCTSSMNTLHKVQKALAANYELLVEGYGKQHDWPDLDGWYMSSDIEWLCRGYCNLKTGEEKWPNALFGSASEKGTALVYCFKPNGDKIKFW